MNYMGDSAWWRNRFKSRKLEIMGHEKCLEEDMPYFPLKGKILDIACGDGRNSIYLARLGYEVLDVDFCEEAINRLTYFANRENLNIRTRIVDLSQDSLNPLEEKFDAIIINHEEFELLDKNVLLDKKNYEINKREFVRYIWRFQ